jgi:hypothetical protein
MIRAYRLIHGPPNARPLLWEWERCHIEVLVRMAYACHHQLVQRYFANRYALARENTSLWTTYYRPRPLSQLWDTWQVWLEEYRALMGQMQELAEVTKAVKMQWAREEWTGKPDTALPPF